MLFTIEALNASEGDCLILVYGTRRRPKLMVIDGGPRGTYEGALLPRLLELRARLGAGETALPIELVVVTHTDSDHIGGVLAWTRELRALRGARPFKIRELWHNSFDDVLGGTEVADAVQFVNALPWRERDGVVASAGEARTLREDAEVLGVAINAEFAGLVARADDGGVEVPCGDGLTLTVLGPAQAQLEEFRKSWDAGLKAAKKGGVASTTALDTSRPNLASITLLAECGGRSMLLAGDARGDHLLQGLEAAGRLSPGATMRVDVFKLPHHGSCRNNTAALLERVRADTYVISADGKHGNPDAETLDRLAAARGAEPYTLVCTFAREAYRTVAGDSAGERERRAALRAFHAWATAQPRTTTIVYREGEAHGVTIALGDERLDG